jgi:hypothetical protein
LSTENETQVSTVVGAILNAVYVKDRQWFIAEALRRGITREQLAAAAITDALRKVWEKRSFR